MSTSALNTSLLRSRLKLKSLQSESLLRAHHPQAVAILESTGVKPGSLRSHAAKLLTAGAAATTLILSPPQSAPALASLPASAQVHPFTPQDLHSYLKDHLKNILPPSVQPLNTAQEDQIKNLLHDSLGLHATPVLEGNHLNQSYGIIGAEQHLPRYPGDSIYAHGEFIDKGLTPGRGAWGYFASSAEELTPDLIDKEKYYVAVQTLYLPDWNIRLAYLRDWYKYRKVVVVNPVNGQVVVADIADSGPSAWTGKHFGGSPEVMSDLGLNIGRQAGAVVLFFVDDPGNNIPLGPIETNLEKPPLLLSS